MERSAEEVRADILQLLSQDRNLTLTYPSTGDAILAAVRAMKSTLMPVRRCYYLDLKGTKQRGIFVLYTAFTAVRLSD